jgi:Rrf2 family protein
MRITAQEEYGLRCLLQLARQPEERSLTLKQLAEREGISPANAGKLMWLLNNAGIVKSVRGIKGGYSLARPASLITVSEIISVFEGAAIEEHCKSFPGVQDVCVHNEDCGIRPVLQLLHDTVSRVLSQVTLAQLANHEIQFNGGERLLQLQRAPKAESASASV